MTLSRVASGARSKCFPKAVGIGKAAGQEQPFSLSFANKDAHDPDSYAHLRKLAEALGRCLEIVAGRERLPLVQADEWSFGWQAELLDRGYQLSIATFELLDMAEALARQAGLTWTGVGETAEVALLLTVTTLPEEGDDVSWSLKRDKDETSLQTIQDNKEHLQDWTRWVDVRLQASGAGLDALVSAVEKNLIKGDVDPAFVSAYAAWWLPLAMDAQPELRSFSHWSHEDAIRRFRALDDRAKEMAAGQVLSRIQHGLPAQDMVARRSELGTLRHQLNLQRPSMPIRELISEMPDSFTKLAPCVLMSPLSVAQYLSAGQAAFDVVIFDEASEITTWDAIGAIARGKQAIIVKDPKQLPPTNFFGRNDAGDEDLPEAERDLASILDEVAAAGIAPQSPVEKRRGQVRYLSYARNVSGTHQRSPEPMTYTDMTKTALNDLLPENLRCKNASQLKKTSKAELIDMLERRDATRADAMALPIYCCLHVVALVIAVVELIVAPSLWCKTTHDVARRNDIPESDS